MRHYLCWGAARVAATFKIGMRLWHMLSNEATVGDGLISVILERELLGTIT